MNFKRTSAIAVAGLLLAGAACAQPPGMGWAMMGGYGGDRMGPGMMGGGHGGYGMGPGMMWGFADQAYAGLDLSPDQRKKIAEIQEQTSRSMWQLMGSMHEQGYRMDGMFGPGAVDETAARKAFQAMSDSRKAMFEMQLDARKRIEAVLTPEQREQLRKYWNR